MTKYVRKGLGDKPTPEAIRRSIFRGKIVEENTTVETAHGGILVTPGNYILTDFEGSKFGITPTDLDLNYTKED